MAQKSANLYARIEPDVKEQAENILSALGIPASNAINMFYKQIILHRGIPFEITLPSSERPDISTMTEKDLSEEIEKGYNDYLKDNVRPATLVFEDIRKDYRV
ncbi:MAG: type II toxin-antitoxin system RelB/DinJ family antitoxin [Lachnospiraceae bacterium]|nr:type II toxin-antitoxin system RelB/DinJ family antitoxin [Lachnospiraceae bacterium]